MDDFEYAGRAPGTLRPSRYGALLDGVESLGLLDMRPIEDQNAALRFVVFVDRLYDRSIPVLASGDAADRLFTADLLAGGYRKKYLRAVSRLISLTKSVAALAGQGADNSGCPSRRTWNCSRSVKRTGGAPYALAWENPVMAQAKQGKQDKKSAKADKANAPEKAKGTGGKGQGQGVRARSKIKDGRVQGRQGHRVQGRQGRGR